MERSLIAIVVVVLGGAYFAVCDAYGDPIGGHDFPAVIDIFTGEDFTRGAAVARWLAPVPEPTTWVLWVGGLAALAARRGRPALCAPRRQQRFHGQRLLRGDAA